MVVVQTTDGKEYEGVLQSGWWEDDGPSGVCLQWARQRVGPQELATKPMESMVIAQKDFVRASAAQVDLYNDELTEAARRRGGEVTADSEIDVAGGRGEFGAERELVMASDWLGSETALGGLEGASAGAGGTQRGWDQFAVNARLGAVSTYSEELYTTKISDKKFSAQQMKEAERRSHIT